MPACLHTSKLSILMHQIISNKCSTYKQILLFKTYFQILKSILEDIQKQIPTSNMLLILYQKNRILSKAYSLVTSLLRNRKRIDSHFC